MCQPLMFFRDFKRSVAFFNEPTGKDSLYISKYQEFFRFESARKGVV